MQPKNVVASPKAPNWDAENRWRNVRIRSFFHQDRFIGHRERARITLGLIDVIAATTEQFWDLEGLEPIEPVPAKGPQALQPYFGEQETPLLHYWQIPRKRKWVVLATFAIVFALSVIATLNAPRLYQATSKVAIFPENPNALGFKDMEVFLPTTNSKRLWRPKSRFCVAML